MSIKLANNAVAHLAASLASTDTTAVLEPTEAGNFPSIGAGDWHPMTILASSGAFEIVKVTARSANIITIERGFDATTARDFLAGDRAEIRMTASVVQTLQSDLATAKTDLQSSIAVGDAAVTASVSASLTASLTATMDTKDAAQTTTLTSLMDSKDAAQQVVVDTKIAAQHTVITSEIAAAKADAIAQAAAYTDAVLAAMSSLTEPVGSIKPWLPASTPTDWVFCYGQALSRTTNASLFAKIGTTYGAGDGSTTFNVPDMRGRGMVGKDNMGGTPANRMTTAGSGLDGTALGAVGGAETHTLTAAQLAAHSHSATTAAAGGHTPSGVTDNEPDHTHTVTAFGTGSGAVIGNGATAVQNTARSTSAGGAHNHALVMNAVADHTHTVTVSNNTGGGGAHNNVQPSLVVQFIIKVQ